MAAPRPLSDDDRDRIRELAKQGLSCNAIAKELGRAPSVISRASTKMGVTFDRSQTKAATEAHALDAAAKRALLSSHLIDDALKIRAQLWEPCVAFNFGGRDNTYAEHNMERPDFAAQEKILRSMAIAVEKSLRLTDYDTGDDAAKVGSLLGSLFGSLQEKHGTGD
ncbi:helix-turn-helix domain-containing protein [Acrocarpospora sp. B8E8]|uniref:helix-turn-helix domain-containing protein n=1 Tax=Acrocarpospora sp. B8E8 TaxID=3153572 RepID=UPI00325D8803